MQQGIEPREALGGLLPVCEELQRIERRRYRAGRGCGCHIAPAVRWRPEFNQSKLRGLFSPVRARLVRAAS
jgi:hypothetical protein